MSMVVVPASLTDTPATRQTLSAVDKVLALYTTLRDEDWPVRLSELSRKTGIAKATAHRMLSALAAAGLAIKIDQFYRATPIVSAHEEDPRYRLLRHLAPFPGDVLLHTGMSASLAVLEGVDVVFRYRVYGHDPTFDCNHEADRRAGQTAAAGRLLLAYDYPRRQRVSVLCSPIELAALNDEIVHIRRQRYAVDVQQDGLTSVAVPIIGPAQERQIALSATGPTRSFDRAYVLRQLQAVAVQASRSVEAVRPTVIQSPTDPEAIAS